MLATVDRRLAGARPGPVLDRVEREPRLRYPFRHVRVPVGQREVGRDGEIHVRREIVDVADEALGPGWRRGRRDPDGDRRPRRSEEHTSELQSRLHLVCRLLLEKKKKTSSSE